MDPESLIEYIFPNFFLVLAIIVNGTSLAIFGIDKFLSKRGGYRIPEYRLLTSAFFGPFGACLGMLVFRHKTRKVKFLFVPVFLVLQVLLVLYFYLR